MRFIGIIEANKEIVQQVINYFLLKEQYSILFICQSMEEYKLLPVYNRKRADILFLEAGSSYFDQLQQVRYLRSVNNRYHIVLLAGPALPVPGAISFMDRTQLTPTLETFFSSALPAGVPKETFAANGHGVQEEPGAAVYTSRVLTSREFEIAELVAKGYTNKRVAQALYISTCTVNAHLRKIFVKLSISSRTELVHRMVND
jgi:DNA-binding CsgD family transcriptional regulator